MHRRVPVACAVALLFVPGCEAAGELVGEGRAMLAEAIAPEAAAPPEAPPTPEASTPPPSAAADVDRQWPTHFEFESDDESDEAAAVVEDRTPPCYLGTWDATEAHGDLVARMLRRELDVKGARRGAATGPILWTFEAPAVGTMGDLTQVAEPATLRASGKKDGVRLDFRFRAAGEKTATYFGEDGALLLGKTSEGTMKMHATFKARGYSRRSKQIPVTVLFAGLFGFECREDGLHLENLAENETYVLARV